MSGLTGKFDRPTRQPPTSGISRHMLLYCRRATRLPRAAIHLLP